MNTSADIDLVIFDPGMAVTGWSAWNEGELVVCGTIRGENRTLTWPPWRRCSRMVDRLTETPEIAMGILRASQGRGNIVVEGTGKAAVFRRKTKAGESQTAPTSLRDTNTMIGCLLDRMRHTYDKLEVIPRTTWSGGRSNPTVKAEMRGWTRNLKLSQDASDAVAIGLWWLGQQKLNEARLNV